MHVARPVSVRAGLAVLVCAAGTAAGAADLPSAAPAARVTPVAEGEGGGGGYWTPRWPLRPAQTRFDIYGYPLLGPGLVGRPDPRIAGVGCPPALQPAYDSDGNLAGYAPLQYCR